MPLTRNQLRNSVPASEPRRSTPRGERRNALSSIPPVLGKKKLALDSDRSSKGGDNGMESRAPVGVNGSKQDDNKETDDSQPAPKVPTSGSTNNMTNSRSPADKNFNILLAVTGSVATIKLTELIMKLQSTFPKTITNKANNTQMKATISLKLVMTEHSKHFVSKDELNKLEKELGVVVHDDSDEWTQWKGVGDPVLHIELRKWADLCLIAPLDANTMGKIANGICDNLITCVARAWDTSKPLILCPAMNTFMYSHPITRDQLCRLQSFGYLRVDSIEKRLACGDFGIGAMANVESIVAKVIDSLIRPPPSLPVALTKPILNQQPTYPIMSTTQLAPSKLPSAAQAYERFKSSNQSTLHTINNRFTLNPIPSSSSLTSSTSSFPTQQLGSIKQHPKYGTSNLGRLKLIITKKNNCGSSLLLNGAKANKIRNVVIPSLQNLRSIDPNYDANRMQFSAEENCDLDVPDEDFNYDLDPTNLLDETLETDDLMIDDQDSGSTQSYGANAVASSDDGNIKDDGLSPFFNTSKFLALCQNTARGCFTCAICKNDYKNRKSMARHLKEQHVQGNIFRCVPCGVSYKRKEKLIKHYRERHNGAIPSSN